MTSWPTITTTRSVRVLAAGALVATGLAALPSMASSAGGCSLSYRGTGGDWPTMGGNDHQSNFQAAEHKINAANVGSMKLAWTSAMPPGQSTPSIAGSCVYFANDGYIDALEVTTGKLVWQSTKQLQYSGDPNFPGNAYVTQGVTVRDGLVEADADNKNKPIAVAYDARTGKQLWTSKPVLFGYPATQLSSPKVADGIHLLFTTGPDYDPHARAGFALIDERTGKTLSARTTVPPKLLKEGYPSTGVWASAAVDDATGYAFVGTANAYSKVKESQYDAAILKIDINRHRSTFGQVVGIYKGDTDAINPVLEQEPACQVIGPQLPDTNYAYAPCGQQDADFGAGPALITFHGHQVLVELRKDGWFYAVDPKTMKGIWKSLIGLNNNAEATGGNTVEPAYDGKNIYVSTNPGTLYAINPADGSTVWLQPMQDSPVPIRPVLAANGLVFTAGAGGTGIVAHDASNGMTVATLSPTAADGTTCNVSEQQGLAIAHNMLFVNCGNFLAAYKLPGQ